MPPVTDTRADRPLAALLDEVASTHPAPGGGPTAAWTCALVAALVEMVSAIELRKEPDDPAATEQRRERAAALRARALELADLDVEAYSEVLAVLRRRDEPGHGARLREALANAAGPPAEIAEVAAELTALAADAVGHARGGVRGEALTAAVLGEAAVRAAAPLVAMNLGGARDDPRVGRMEELTRAAAADLERAHGGRPTSPRGR